MAPPYLRRPPWPRHATPGSTDGLDSHGSAAARRAGHPRVRPRDAPRPGRPGPRLHVAGLPPAGICLRRPPSPALGTRRRSRDSQRNASLRGAPPWPMIMLEQRACPRMAVGSIAALPAVRVGRCQVSLHYPLQRARSRRGVWGARAVRYGSGAGVGGTAFALPTSPGPRDVRSRATACLGVSN